MTQRTACLLMLVIGVQFASQNSTVFGHGEILSGKPVLIRTDQPARVVNRRLYFSDPSYESKTEWIRMSLSTKSRQAWTIEVVSKKAGAVIEDGDVVHIKIMDKRKGVLYREQYLMAETRGQAQSGRYTESAVDTLKFKLRKMPGGSQEDRIIRQGDAVEIYSVKYPPNKIGYFLPEDPSFIIPVSCEKQRCTWEFLWP